MELFLLICLLVGLPVMYFLGWYMCENTYYTDGPYGFTDDSDKFYMDEKLNKYKADDHE